MTTFFGKLRRRIKRTNSSKKDLRGGGKSDVAAKPDTPLLGSGSGRKQPSRLQGSPKSSSSLLRKPNKPAPSSPTSVTALDNNTTSAPRPPPPPPPKRRQRLPPEPPNPREQVLPRVYRQQIPPSPRRAGGAALSEPIPPSPRRAGGAALSEPVLRLDGKKKNDSNSNNKNEDVPFDERGAIAILDMKELPPPADAPDYVPGRADSFEAKQNENGDVEILSSTAAVVEDGGSSVASSPSQHSATVAVVKAPPKTATATTVTTPRAVSPDMIAKSGVASLAAKEGRGGGTVPILPPPASGTSSARRRRKPNSRKEDPDGVKWTEDPEGGKWTEVKSVPSGASHDDDYDDITDDQSSLHLAQATDWTMTELEESMALQDGEICFDDEEDMNGFVPSKYKSSDSDEKQPQQPPIRSVLMTATTPESTVAGADYTPAFASSSDNSTAGAVVPTASRSAVETEAKVETSSASHPDVYTVPTAATTVTSMSSVEVVADDSKISSKTTLPSPPTTPVQSSAQRSRSPVSRAKQQQRPTSPEVVAVATGVAAVSASCFNKDDDAMTPAQAFGVVTGCSPRSLRFTKRVPSFNKSSATLMMPTDEEQSPTPSATSSMEQPPPLSTSKANKSNKSVSSTSSSSGSLPPQAKQQQQRPPPTSEIAMATSTPPQPQPYPRRNMTLENMDRYAPAKHTLRNGRSMLSSEDESEDDTFHYDEEKKDDDDEDDISAEYIPLHGSKSYSTQFTDDVDDNDSTFNFQEEEEVKIAHNQQQQQRKVVGDKHPKSPPKIFTPPSMRTSLVDDDDTMGSSSMIAEEVIKRKKKQTMNPSKSAGNLAVTIPRKTLATRRSRSDASFGSSINGGTGVTKSFDEEQTTSTNGGTEEPPAARRERKALQRLRNTMRRRRKQQKDTRPHHLYDREDSISYDASTFEGSSVGTGTVTTMDSRGTSARYSVYSALQEYEDERSSLVTSGSDDDVSVSADEEDYSYTDDEYYDSRVVNKQRKQQRPTNTAATNKTKPRRKEPSLTQELSEMGREFGKDPTIIMEWMNLR